MRSPADTVGLLTGLAAGVLLAASCSIGELTSSGDSTQPTGQSSDSEQETPANASVERVIDGDTIEVRINGSTETVRLLGIDAPETVSPSKPVQCYGPEASAYLSQALPTGSGVILVRDVELRDQYDRLLAYVIRSDDLLFINLDLVAKGYATVLAWAPNTHYEEHLTTAESQARSGAVGLWGVCGGPGVPLE